MAAPLNTCTAIEQRGVVWFLWAKDMAAKDIHKEMLPMYGEHCLSVKQSSKTTSFGGTLSWQWRGGMSSVRVVQTATTRILRHRFPRASETVGQVFKFVWRLHWKINALCMSLSPLVSFKSRFVTYLLNFPRIILPSTPTSSEWSFPSGVWTQMLYAYIFFPLRASFAAI